VAEAACADQVDRLVKGLLVDRLYFFGSTPLSGGLSRSIATIVSSTSLPIGGCLARTWRNHQRASVGTQKMLEARY
jgi:hypothetical protein